jgi:hypothetical protein
MQIAYYTTEKEAIVMRRDADMLKEHPASALPENRRFKMSREKIMEAAVIAATVASMLVLSTALRLGLERYTIAAM